MKLKTGLGLIAILLSSGGCVSNRSLNTIPEPECNRYNPNLYGPDSTVVDDMNSINDCRKYQK